MGQELKESRQNISKEIEIIKKEPNKFLESKSMINEKSTGEVQQQI